MVFLESYMQSIMLIPNWVITTLNNRIQLECIPSFFLSASYFNYKVGRNQELLH